MAIYGHICLDCPSSYLGATEKTLRTRLNEHERPTSPVAEHTIKEHHQIDWDGVRILDREEDWYRIGVREFTYGDLAATSTEIMAPPISVEVSAEIQQRPQQRPEAPWSSSCLQQTFSTWPKPINTCGSIWLSSYSSKINSSVAKEDLWMQIAGYHSSESNTVSFVTVVLIQFYCTCDMFKCQLLAFCDGTLPQFLTK